MENKNKERIEKGFERHCEWLSELFKSFKSPNSVWPELEGWDYQRDYSISPSVYEANYGKYNKKACMSSSEALFKYAAMQGATRNELIRILKWILINFDAEKYYLDYKKAREDLGIIELRNKYLNRDSQNLQTI